MTRLRKLSLSIGAALVLAAVALTVYPALVPHASIGTPTVVSIKSSHDYQNPALLKKAWALPVAQLYARKIEFQRNGSVCGPASLANVAHSLGQSTDQKTILRDTGTATVLGYLPRGLTLDQLAAIAALKLGHKVTVLRNLTLAQFREELVRVNDTSRRYIVNFTRAPLFGVGGGHFSPVAGYLPDENLVFVLDVNDQYEPWLTTPERLYEAMDTVDADANAKRGLLLIE